ncbi:PEGA domain-containing protein [Bradyrhizobium sp. HKCCYLS20291]|uniref:PEGA domain-containing protein n=1 Tax=Bradyrhizobium sp. HKCCYLS20291 TaxID=3420766 RepID=UPI003EBF1C07
MRVVVLVALCATLGGCASVTRGTTETISVASTPSGAEATIAGLEAPMSCTTPCSFVAKRNADISVTIEKPGYETQIIPLQKDIPTAGAAGFAGNLLLGGVIGMGVDAATGAATDHKPNPVIVTLQPRMAAPPVARQQRPPRRGAPAPAPAQPEAGT